MIDTDILEILYAGNVSTVTPYPIPFPYLEDPTYIKAAILFDGAEDEVILDPDAYDVTPAGVVMDAAYAAADVVRIYRELPFTQPGTFPDVGQFSNKEMERLFDRQEMQIQQLRRMISGGGVIESSGVQDVASWFDVAARGAKKPTRRGQLGVQTDSNTLWVANSTNTGDWGEIGTTYAQWCWDYEAVAPTTALVASAAKIYLSHAPHPMTLSGGLRISVAKTGDDPTVIQVYVGGVAILAAPISFTGETVLVPLGLILPSRRNIQAGKRLEAVVVDASGGYNLTNGLRVAFIGYAGDGSPDPETPDHLLTTDGYAVLTVDGGFIIVNPV